MIRFCNDQNDVILQLYSFDCYRSVTNLAYYLISGLNQNIQQYIKMTKIITREV